jgi:probable HAF family extracellular repeat protein
MASPNRTEVLRRFRLSVIAFTAAMAITAASVAAPPEGSRFRERGGATGTETRQLPGFLLEKGRYVTIDVPRRLWETAPEGIGPIGINDLGQIVGSYTDNRGMVHGFLLDRRRARFANIDVPGALGTQAERINNGGQIVGKYAEDLEDVQNNTLRAFLFDRGRFVRLDFPRARQTLAHGINARGQVVGEYTDRTGTIHGFRWERGRFTTIDGPRRRPGGLVEINDRGQMLGLFGPDDAARGFLLGSGAYATFAFPRARFTVPYGLNNRGQIVGAATTENPNVATAAQGFILAKGIGGRFTPLDRPGWSITVPFDINNRGQIVGVAVNSPPTSQGGTSLMGAMSDVERSAGPVTSR